MINGTDIKITATILGLFIFMSALYVSYTYKKNPIDLDIIMKHNQCIPEYNQYEWYLEDE